jgi:hypothetical protein
VKSTVKSAVISGTQRPVPTAPVIEFAESDYKYDTIQDSGSGSETLPSGNDYFSDRYEKLKKQYFEK